MQQNRTNRDGLRKRPFCTSTTYSMQKTNIFGMGTVGPCSNPPLITNSLYHFKTKMEAFASSKTFSLAPTVRHLLTALINWWDCRPHYLPNITFFPPAPVGRTLHIHLTCSCLAPNTARLIGCMFDVLC